METVARTPPTLREALDIGPGEVIAIVGGGGKTTLLYGIGRETAAAGGRAIVTGTTRFTPAAGEAMPPLVMAESADALLPALQQKLAEHALVVAGAGWGNQGRILPVEPALLAEMKVLPGVTAVVAEADGSSGRPFKAPAAHEPVVAPATTLLLTVVGLDVLGRPLGPEAVHRPEIVAEIAAVEMGCAISEEIVACVLLDERGGRKGLPAGARWIPVLNKADSRERVQAARRIGEHLLRGGAERVVIAHAALQAPVEEVMQ